MKAILVVDIPDDYQEYGSGKWYIKGELLRIGYKEKSGNFIGKKPIENEMVQLKPMPQKLQENYMLFGEEVVWQKAIGYNMCVDEILGE